jgi:hypothetical protein
MNKTASCMLLTLSSAGTQAALAAVKALNEPRPVR